MVRRRRPQPENLPTLTIGDRRAAPSVAVLNDHTVDPLQKGAVRQRRGPHLRGRVRHSASRSGQRNHIVSPFVISQTLVAVAICFDLLSFQFKERGRIIACLVISCTLISIHFAILGHWTATGLGLLATLRFLSSLVTTSKKVMVVFMAASAAITIFTFNGLLSILSGSGSLFGTAGTFCRDDRRLRQLMLIGTSLWLIHNILAGTPMAVLMEVLFITSNLVGYYRFYLKRL